MDLWSIMIIVYLAFAVGTAIPIVLAGFRGVELDSGGMSFDDSGMFSKGGKERLIQHYSRIQGTLYFWKSRAIMFRRFHYYCTIWTILSAWAVPILGVVSQGTAGGTSQWLLIAISSHVALALSLHRGMKVSECMRAFRHGESEFYDLYRRLLDRPKSFGESEEEQIEIYFAEVERIRAHVRNAETENFPVVDRLTNGTLGV